MNCNNGTLSVYVPDQNNPWNISKVLFVFRRLGFSVKFKEVKNYLDSNPNDLIDELFDKAVNMPVSPDPGWANFNSLANNAVGVIIGIKGDPTSKNLVLSATKYGHEFLFYFGKFVN